MSLCVCKARPPLVAGPVARDNYIVMFASIRSARPLLGLALAFALACAPSTKGETQQWERNKAAVVEYSASWPGFKTVLDAKLVAAEPAWTSALAVSGEEEKAKAMDAANDLFDPIMGKLRQVKSKKEGIESSLTKLENVRLNTSKHQERRAELAAEAYETLTGIEEAMAAATPADEAAAVVIADEQIGKMIGLASRVDSMYKKYKPSTSSRKKGKKGKK